VVAAMVCVLLCGGEFHAVRTMVTKKKKEKKKGEKEEERRHNA
jgi:hypothetical protein